MSIDSGLRAALAFVLPAFAAAPLLLLAAAFAARLFKGARGAARDRVIDLTDAGIRIGDGASTLRFGLEVQPSGRTAFRAETRRAARD
jgi:hypothetical protein